MIKLWEEEPESVEYLFCDILFSDAHGDVSTVQDNMDRFLDEYEILRQKYFPGNWSFKQDRHSASVFLAMNAPDFNYVFKSNEAQTMAKYVDFGFSIGAGMSFSLTNYYRLCEETVAALKEHESLLSKHFDRLTEGYYVDKSLHLLAFDLMYCCRNYNFYKGLVVPSSGTTLRRTKTLSHAEEDLAQKEAARLAKIVTLEQEIAELERGCNEYEDISLIGVQVTTMPYGIGTVIAQTTNKITVRFAEVEKSYILDKKYSARPQFENDEDVVSAFTEYGQIQEQIKRLQRELAKLQA